jgi:ketosteroid isomerase-like protein
VALDSSEIAERLGRLEAIELIRRLMYDYGCYVDLNETEKLAELFTDDCSASYGVGFGAEGIEQYRELVAGIGTYFAATCHYITNIVVDLVDDSTANVRAIVYAWHRYKRDRPDSHWMGYYQNVVVRTADDTWKIQRLEMNTVNMVNHHLRPDSPIPIGRRE